VVSSVWRLAAAPDRRAWEVALLREQGRVAGRDRRGVGPTDMRGRVAMRARWLAVERERERGSMAMGR
jgi:hypothetical protein